MKNRIEKIVVILFVFAMCLLMSISAHAGNRYFFSSTTMPSEIGLDGVTITPTNGNGQFSEDPRIVFNENVCYFARVRENQSTTTATKFTIDAQSQGVLLVYYIRSYDGEPIANDGGDLNIEGMDGVVEYYEKGLPNSTCTAVKFFVLNTGTYTMTSIEKTCGVYGFVYMPGNVGAYNPKGVGDLNLIGQCYTGDYSNLQTPRKDDWYFEGWYKDDAFTQKVMPNTVINEPTVLFAHWARCVWDLTHYRHEKLVDNMMIEYDGIVIYGSDNHGTNEDGSSFSSFNDDEGLRLIRKGTKGNGYINDCVVFTPKYDGELTLTYNSTHSSVEYRRICAVGTDIVHGSEISELEDKPNVVACGVAAGKSLKNLQANLKAGTTYYIYQASVGGIAITRMKYTASASSADVDGNSVTLTTTANMQGWRAFYDQDNSYTVDENTNVYIAVSVEDGEENDKTQTVKFINKTGKKVPVGCAVVLHSDAVQADGTYLITMTKDANPYEYNVGDNLLRHSEAGFAVDAYRLGYRSGEGNGVAFYSWKADNPSEGIVYLEQPSNSAKIAFEIEDAPTGIASVRNEQENCNQYFNLNGQRLAAPQKGLNIINGKKCIVR